MDEIHSIHGDIDAIDEPTLSCDDGGRQTERLTLGGLAFPIPCLVMGRVVAAGVPKYVPTRSAWYINGQPKTLCNAPRFPRF